MSRPCGLYVHWCVCERERERERVRVRVRVRVYVCACVRVYLAECEGEQYGRDADLISWVSSVTYDAFLSLKFRISA